MNQHRQNPVAPTLALLAALTLPAVAIFPAALQAFSSSQAFSLALLAPLPLLAWLWFQPQATRLHAIKPFASTLLFIIIWTAISGAMHPAKNISLDWTISFTAAAALFPAAWLLGSRPGMSAKIIAAILAATALHLGYALLQLTGGDPWPWTTTFDGRPGGFFGNPNFLAGHLAMILPLILAWALSTRRRKAAETALAWFMVALSLLILAATQTRGAWIAAAAGLLLFFVLSRRAMPGLLTRNRRPLTVMLTAAILLSALALATRPQLRQRLFTETFSSESSLGKRLVLMKNTITLANRNPLLGAGPGQLRLHYPLVQAADLKGKQQRSRDYVMTSHSHNDYLQLAAESGFPAAAAWLLFWLLLFKTALGSPALASSISTQRPASDTENSDTLSAAALLSGLAALQVHALSNFPMLIPPTLMTAMAMAGLLMAMGQPAPTQPASSARKSASRWLAAGLLVAAAWLAAGRGRDLAAQKLWWTAQGEFKLKNIQAAETAVHAALALMPAEDRLWSLKANIQKNQGLPAPAAKSLEEALRLHPHNALARVELANYYSGINDDARVAELLGPLVQAAPNLQGWWHLYGAALFNTGQWEACAQAYERAIFFGTEAQASMVNRAACLGNLGRYQEAMDQLNHALRVNPRGESALITRAITLFKMGNKEQALRDLRYVLALNPDNQAARNYLNSMDKP